MADISEEITAGDPAGDPAGYQKAANDRLAEEISAATWGLSLLTWRTRCIIHTLSPPSSPGLPLYLLRTIVRRVKRHILRQMFGDLTLVVLRYLTAIERARCVCVHVCV